VSSKKAKKFHLKAKKNRQLIFFTQIIIQIVAYFREAYYIVCIPEVMKFDD